MLPHKGSPRHVNKPKKNWVYYLVNIPTQFKGESSEDEKSKLSLERKLKLSLEETLGKDTASKEASTEQICTWDGAHWAAADAQGGD